MAIGSASVVGDGAAMDAEAKDQKPQRWKKKSYDTIIESERILKLNVIFHYESIRVQASIYTSGSSSELVITN